MVAVAAGTARRLGAHRRRSSPLARGRSSTKSKDSKQQLLILPSPTEPFNPNNNPNNSEISYAMAALECVLGVARALFMGSCLTGDDRRAPPNSPRNRRRGSRKRPGSRGSSLEGIRAIPGRLAANGFSSSGIASVYTQQGKKGVNQDAMIVWENFGQREDTIFCGVFDGHGPYGHLVAKRVRDHLPLKLSTSLASSDDNYENANAGSISTSVASESETAPFLSEEKKEKATDFYTIMKEYFLKAFKVMDKDLRLHGNIDCFFSGTTAVTMVKQGQDLIIGNLGDSRAVLATRDTNNCLLAVQLTVDLKPNVPREAERIRRCKGRVFALKDEPEVARVWLPNYNTPGLAMARAFGDFCLKGFGLISEPVVSHRRITERDEFVVLASDGVWDVLTNQEVVDIVASVPSRDSAARSLVECAVRAWRLKYPTSKIDDCAVVCLFLNTETNDDPSDAENGIDSADGPSCSGEAPLEQSGSEGSLLNDDTGPATMEEWSALEGVSRANTLFTLPRYVAGSAKKLA